MIRKFIQGAILAFPLIANAQTFQVNVNVPIPDNPGPNAVIPVPVTGLPNSINSAFGLSQVCINITHTWDSDLDISLMSPDGTTKKLISGVGGNGDHFAVTCLANNGSNGYIVNGSAPFNGTYIPMNSLNLFNNNQDPNGSWQLIIDDTYAADTGSVHMVNLTFSVNPPSDPLPPPVICTTCACPGGAPSCDMLPDMTASALIIQQQHVEGPGFYNIANATPNIGIGPLEIHGSGNCFCNGTPVSCTTTICPGGQSVKEQVIQRVYVRTNNNDTLTYFDHIAGFMSYHPTHGHIHVDNWANYTIRQATSNPDATTWPILGTGTKQSFCLINLSDCSSDYGYCVDTSGTILSMSDVLNAGFGFFSGCGRDQGIYPGMLDIYDIGLNDPIDLTGFCNGNYYLVSITDPDNNFLESNDNNNWVAVPITLTQQMQPPSANFTPLQNGAQVAFTASNLVNASSWTWDYGDGNSDQNINPAVHTYTANGTYTVTLTVNSPCGTFTYSIQVVITTVGIIENNIPAGYFLSSFPNPSTGTIKISFYAVYDNEHIELGLTDFMGKEILMLHNGQTQRGIHEINLDLSASDVQNGVYFLRMKTRERSITQKIVFVK